MASITNTILQVEVLPSIYIDQPLLVFSGGALNTLNMPKPSRLRIV